MTPGTDTSSTTTSDYTNTGVNNVGKNTNDATAGDSSTTTSTALTTSTGSTTSTSSGSQVDEGRNTPSVGTEYVLVTNEPQTMQIITQPPKLVYVGEIFQTSVLCQINKGSPVAKATVSAGVLPDE